MPRLSITDPSTRRVLAWVEFWTGPLRPLRTAARCSHCHRGRRKPYKAYCRRCDNAYQRWYYHRTHGSIPPAGVERYREAFLALATPAPRIPHLPLGMRWCSSHRQGCPADTFSRNRWEPDGLERSCRRARREWRQGRLEARGAREDG